MEDSLQCYLDRLPAQDVDLQFLKVLVYGEEMGHLFEKVRRDVVQVLVAGKQGICGWHC